MSEEVIQNQQNNAGEELAEFYREDSLDEFYDTRNNLLKDIPYETVRKSWFVMSHLLLGENAKIIDMGCGGGERTYIMAALNPTMRFIGVDKSKRNINKAREKYQLHNLEFQVGGFDGADIAPNSVDAIINDGVLHHVFSGARYNADSVLDSLKSQMKALKIGGTMFIRDFARPPPEAYVLLELQDRASASDALKDLSEADLLVWYSEHARPKQDPGCRGFFLEELPPRKPRMRLFRLPYKWAYEFLMRKDDREIWERDLPLEFTFFTEQQFRHNLRGLGARVHYSAPLYDEAEIEKRFENKFRLYDDNDREIGYPPTGYVAVAQKLTERKSLHIVERRPSNEAHKSSLRISAMRNEKSGELVDVVSRDIDVSEVLPFRIGDDGRLKVYLHDGIPRGIINTVMRGGRNIDGKRWSGHLAEAISIEAGIILDFEELNYKNSVKFARDYLGLKPRPNEALIQGPDYYPAPDFIDERVFTYYLNVEKARGAVSPKSFVGHTGDFLAKGHIVEFDAQQVLNAITVGMIPNARLELQIMSLFNHLKIRCETWTNRDMKAAAGKISAKIELREVLKGMAGSDHRFREVRGTAGHLRSMHSIFVEEGQTGGSVSGLTSADMDFVISDVTTINTAVVVPLTKSMKTDIHAGFAVDHLPVPQRHEGNGMTLKAPSFNIPDRIQNLKHLKEFIAEKFGVTPDMVVKMGEGYYTQIGMTPQRIFPFAVGSPPDWAKDPMSFMVPISQFHLMWSLAKKSTNFMTVLARSFKAMDSEIFYEYKREVQAILTSEMQNKGNFAAPQWGIPVSYQQPPGMMPEKKAEPAPAMNTAPQAGHDAAPVSKVKAEPVSAVVNDAAPAPTLAAAPVKVQKGGISLKSSPAAPKMVDPVKLKGDFEGLRDLAKTVKEIQSKTSPDLAR